MTRIEKVQAEHGGDAELPEIAVGQHVDRSRRRDLLAGLEHRHQPAAEVGRAEHASDQGQGGHVHVVSAEVTDAWRLRRKGIAAAFLDRQGVQFGAGTERRAALSRRAEEPLAHPGHLPGGQIAEQLLDGAVLGAADLRIRVQALPEGDRGGQQVVHHPDGRCQRLAGPVVAQRAHGLPRS